MKRFIAPVLAGLLCAFAALSAGASQPELVFVLNSRDATVSLIDKAKRVEISRLTVGKEPHHLYPTPDGRSLIIGNAMSDDLIFVDPVTAAVQRRVAAVDDPYQLGFSPDRRWFGVAALRLDRVDLYRHDNGELKLAKRMTLPKAPSHLWFSADSSMVFVTLQDSGEIAAIALPSMEIAWKMRTGSQPAGIVVTRDDRYLLVGVMGEDYVDVIDWRERKRVKRIVTGKGAHNLRGAGDGRHVFVSNRVANSISRIDLQTMSVVDTINVPGGPDCMELTADGRFLWVTQRFARQVAVIDLNERRIVDTITVGRSPHGIFFRNRAPLM